LCCPLLLSVLPFFFFTAPAPSSIYTLSLHDALPISLYVIDGVPLTMTSSKSFVGGDHGSSPFSSMSPNPLNILNPSDIKSIEVRSEEHTSELQSRFDLVCRLLLEKKKNKKKHINKLY